MQTALLLIDVQQSFMHRPYWTTDDVPAFLAHSNALLAGCAERGLPVLRIFHTDGPRSRDNPFAPESGLIRPLDGLAPFDASAAFEKHRHSELVGTGLPVWLRQLRRGPEDPQLSPLLAGAGQSRKQALAAAGVAGDRQWRRLRAGAGARAAAAG